jgi:nitrate reductase gamma subunit
MNTLKLIFMVSGTLAAVSCIVGIVLFAIKDNIQQKNGSSCSDAFWTRNEKNK